MTLCNYGYSRSQHRAGYQYVGRPFVRIAIADDDLEIRQFVSNALTTGGHICVVFANGREMITALQRDSFDLLVIDWNMPIVEGIDVIRWAHGHMSPVPPIIVLTSRTDKSDVVQALEAGADDYIIKPEDADVILARVAAAFRRTGPRPSSERVEAFGPYHFDRLTSSVSFGGKSVALTAKEFALARLFFENFHRPLARGYILQMIWNSVADLPTRTLDMHVSRLRTKLELRPENGYSLQTVFGFGYRLESFAEEA
jgi:DNA-binding response OmpR family regulator